MFATRHPFAAEICGRGSSGVYQYYTGVERRAHHDARGTAGARRRHARGPHVLVAAGRGDAARWRPSPRTRPARARCARLSRDFGIFRFHEKFHDHVPDAAHAEDARLGRAPRRDPPRRPLAYGPRNVRVLRVLARGLVARVQVRLAHARRRGGARPRALRVRGSPRRAPRRLYRNGPALTEQGGVEYKHMLDGDAVYRFEFEDGTKETSRVPLRRTCAPGRLPRAGRHTRPGAGFAAASSRRTRSTRQKNLANTNGWGGGYAPARPVAQARVPGCLGGTTWRASWRRACSCRPGCRRAERALG